MNITVEVPDTAGDLAPISELTVRESLLNYC